MRKYLIIPILIFSYITAHSQPLPVKLKHTVVIDTDCGIDDLRALCFLLDRPETDIKAVLISDGSLPPAEGALKVMSLLHEFGRDSVPVACGNLIRGVNPPWREFNRQVRWGRSEAGSGIKNVDAITCLSKKLSEAGEKITLICLGPLTNIAGLIKKDPSLLSGAEKIIWYNDYAKPLRGFNYECDKESADIVLKTKVKTDIISNLDKDKALFDKDMYDLCSNSESRLGKVLYFVNSQPVVQEKLQQNHFRLNDDLVAFYITNPELFSINTGTDRLNVRYNVDYDLNGIKEVISDMISGNYVAEHNVVFNRFPVNRENFNYDIRPIIDSAIALYGPAEWKANVMTDEFHGHLGVFSIVGAKMGIRARELFGVGPDQLEVISFAGTKPPYSCLNDGIQVSTGATLGMGTIRLAADTITQPSALFRYKGRSVRISLKKEYLEKVEADINEGIVKFGLLDDGYWKMVRHNALRYWLKWDRSRIFDIEEVDQGR